MYSKTMKLILVSSLTLSMLACGGDNAPEGPEDSEGRLTLAADIDAKAFHPIGADVRFSVVGASLSAAAEDLPRIYLNDAPLSQTSIVVSSGDVVVQGVLANGKNAIEVFATDTEGMLLTGRATLWAGADTLAVAVVDPALGDTSQTQVTLALTGNPTVSVSKQGANVNFANVPTYSLSLTATTNDDRRAALPVAGDEQSVTLSLSGLGDPSAVDNNDFSAGTAGWNVGSAPTTLVPHPGGANGDMDLVVSAPVFGPQSISRTILIPTGVRSVSLTYRVLTDDIVRGNFGIGTDDQFSVSLRNPTEVVTDSNTTSGLGESAFDATGATDWRTLSLPVIAGDTVRMDIQIFNGGGPQFALRSGPPPAPAVQVAGAQTSATYVAIKKLRLNDIENATPLKYLSGGQHAFFDGNTRVHGTIEIRGNPGDTVTSVDLEVVQGATVVALGTLTPAATSILLQPFGANGILKISTSQLLFEIDTKEPSNDLVTELPSDMLLPRVRVKVSPANGGSAVEAAKDSGEVKVLVEHYFWAARYSNDRDLLCGGDAWIRSNLLDSLDRLARLSTDFEFNDVSNMNGGDFFEGPRCDRPNTPHASHKDGFDIDAKFAGYDHAGSTASASSAVATANKLLEFLNDPGYGPGIQMLFVHYDHSGTEQRFWGTIAGKMVADGKGGTRPAGSVIRQAGGHRNHFHVRFFKDFVAPAPGTGSTCADTQGPGFVACPLSGQCIFQDWFCDGAADCPDGEDEVLDHNGNACP